jgi:hypothetical protein
MSFSKGSLALHVDASFRSTEQVLEGLAFVSLGSLVNVTHLLSCCRLLYANRTEFFAF